MAQSTKSKKPEKPYPGFVLTAHPTGQWTKKHKGRQFYFGTDWKLALDEYQRGIEWYRRGLDPPADKRGLTVVDACNHFLTAKALQRQAGEIGERHFDDLRKCCGRIIEFFGRDCPVAILGPTEFEQLRAELAKRYGVTRLANEIVRTRMVFNYCWSAGHIDTQVRFGPMFKKPAKKRVRAKRQADNLAHGKRLFTPEQIKLMLTAANPHMRAMILLGIQSGMGPSDLGQMPLESIDLSSGWIDYPRPKTMIDRRIPLWPETIEAMKDSLRHRTKPRAECSHLFFVNEAGGPMWTEMVNQAISKKFRKLTDDLKIYRKGLTHYTLRHTFRTVADRCTDRPAVDCVMGHGDHSVADNYREGVSDDRLRAVVDLVHAWLYGEEGGAQ
jgi:integrase